MIDDTHAKDAEKMFSYWLSELEATSWRISGLGHEDEPKPPEVEVPPKEAVEEFLKKHPTFQQYEERLIEMAAGKCSILVDQQKWAGIKKAS